jgi:cytochrome c oxidase subunit 1/cytochrome c oxidase subunit I+III
MTALDVETRPEIREETPDLAERMEEIWKTKPGLLGIFGTTDHKHIGIRYLITAFAFLILGGLEALVMRIQLAQPGQHVLTPEEYNQLYSTHGMTMIFLYALPILSGFSNYVFPLVLGSRDMAFPRMNAFSYWVFVAAGLFMYAGFLMGRGPNAGWFNYVPYASRPYNPGLNIDFYSLGMIFFGVSTTVGAINFCVTLLKCRAPGMSINRLPVVVWGTFTANAANILVVPAVSLAFFLLWMDRNLGTHFYEVSGGGRPLLWQHLFWMFAHPWVYVIVLPAMGFVSDALPVFCRRPLVGYTPVVLGTITTMILGFGVWVHHMFATGLPSLALSFFSAASLMIVIPSAVAVFAWTATIWLGRPVFTTAFHFFASMIVLFVIGGVSGFMTASAPVDWQLTDTYFVVAHIHYVLIGINVFPVVGAVYYWFPKFTGRLLDERLGKWNFWLMFAGFNLGFLPMHWNGLLGMPRRIYTYPDGLGWNTLNMIETVGAFLFAAGVLLFVINVGRSLTRGRPSGPNPWDGYTLEWSVPSPTPSYNFAVIPTVASRHPLWEDRLQETHQRSVLHRGLLLDHEKEYLAVSTMDGEPKVILKAAEDTPVPFFMTVAMCFLFTGLLLHLWWAVIVGFVGMLASLIAWLWPNPKLAIRAGASR